MAAPNKTSWADESDDEVHHGKSGDSQWKQGNPFGGAQPAAEVSHQEHHEPIEPKGEPHRAPRTHQYGDRPPREYRHDRPPRGDRDNRDNYDRNRDREGGWTQAGRTHREDRRQDDRDRRPYREPKIRKPVPFPEVAPFFAYVGNLQFGTPEADIISFFGSDIKVAHVRLVFDKITNKPKGHCYVEFEDLESLRAAVGKNGESLANRPLKIDVADFKPDHKREGGEKSFSRPSYESAPLERGGGDVGSPEHKERPKIELQKRSADAPRSSDAMDIYQNSKVNPFGAAKPRDEEAALKKIEEERKKREEESKTGAAPAEKESEKPQESPESPAHHQQAETNDHPKGERREGGRGTFIRDRKEGGDRPPRGDRNFNKEGGGRGGKQHFNKDRKEGGVGGDKKSTEFVRGSKSQQNNKPRKEERRENRPPRTFDAMPTLQKQQVSVTNKNVFGALGEEDA